MIGIPDIETLADKQAITELIYTYCRSVDRLGGVPRGGHPVPRGPPGRGRPMTASEGHAPCQEGWRCRLDDGPLLRREKLAPLDADQTRSEQHEVVARRAEAGVAVEKPKRLAGAEEADSPGGQQ